MRPSPAILFDLDGTLVDSARGIALALEAVAGPQRKVNIATVRSLVSLGAEALVKGALNVADLEVPSTMAAFRKAYAEAPCEIGDAFPGVGPALEWLKHNEIKVGVCTNKPQRLAELVLDRLGLAPWIDVVVGGVAELPPKPAAAPIYRTLELLGGVVRPLYIGDSETDALACQSAGVPFVFVSFGYGELDWETDCVGVLSDFADLRRLVQGFFGGDEDVSI